MDTKDLASGRKGSIKFISASGGAGCYNNVDFSHIAEFTRENVARWLEKADGAPDPYPISPVQDFYAVCGNVEIPWATEKARLAYEKGMEELDRIIRKSHGGKIPWAKEENRP